MFLFTGLGVHCDWLLQEETLSNFRSFLSAGHMTTSEIMDFSADPGFSSSVELILNGKILQILWKCCQLYVYQKLMLSVFWQCYVYMS